MKENEKSVNRKHLSLDAPLMDLTVKKYRQSDNKQTADDRRFWQRQTVEFKLDVLEFLRQDAIKLGLYPDYHEDQERLRRVSVVIKQK